MRSDDFGDVLQTLLFGTSAIKYHQRASLMDRDGRAVQELLGAAADTGEV